MSKEWVYLNMTEKTYSANVARAHRANDHHYSPEHDPGCPGEHPFEMSSNKMVVYPCPR